MLSGRLKVLLSERNISIQEYAEMCDLPLETVRNAYYGKTNDIKLSTAMKMAEALNMSVNCLIGKCPHSDAEQAILKNYRQCGHHGKSLIELVARYEAHAAINERESLRKHKIPCLIPHGNIRNGISFDNCEVVEIITPVQEAYVSIEITNNDLLPMYCKDDVILLENRFPTNKEYAAFYKEGKIYIREYIEESGHYKLRCLHNQGTDIVLKRMNEIEYIGTCIGVVRT